MINEYDFYWEIIDFTELFILQLEAQTSTCFNSQFPHTIGHI